MVSQTQSQNLMGLNGEKIGRRRTVKTNTRDVDSITWVIFFKLLTNRTFSKNGIGYAD